MNYGEIKKVDIANGEGVRVSLFVSGCTHHCKNCFNEATWDFNFGKAYTQETEEYILDLLNHDYIAGLSILGGEPFEFKNQESVAQLVEKAKDLYPQKNIWVYSGYVFEELHTGGKMNTPFVDKILKNIDILVDGEFVEEKKNITLKFRGSENQRLINIPETLKSGKVIIWDK